MSVSTMSLFFALLAVVAQIAVVAGVLLWLIGRGSPAGAAVRDGAFGAVRDGAIWLAWGVAAVATSGSLYYSEVAHLIPCELCWYQRIAMYPLVVILGIAAWRHERAVARVALPLVAIGGSISIVHYLIQRFPDLAGSASCDPTSPCTVTYVWQLGYISIPLMALSGFLLIAMLVLIGTGRSSQRAASENDGEVIGDALRDQTTRA